MVKCELTSASACDRAWQIALDQARTVRMVANAGISGAPPPYSSSTTYVQAYPEPNGGYYGVHPPPYGNLCSSHSYNN